MLPNLRPPRLRWASLRRAEPADRARPDAHRTSSRQIWSVRRPARQLSPASRPTAPHIEGLRHPAPAPAARKRCGSRADRLVDGPLDRSTLRPGGGPSRDTTSRLWVVPPSLQPSRWICTQDLADQVERPAYEDVAGGTRQLFCLL